MRKYDHFQPSVNLITSMGLSEFICTVNVEAHIQIDDSNSTQTRASRREVMLAECLTELCSSFKSVFKHVSQRLYLFESILKECHTDIILLKQKGIIIVPLPPLRTLTAL